MAIEGISLPFREAIEYFERKVNLPTRAWDDLRHGAHVRAWSIAGMTKDDMLADMRRLVDTAIRSGTSFEDFQRGFNELVDRTGWKFKARGKTQEERRAWRARVIYQTNMRTAYMAGRYKQMTEPAVLKYRPYWRYRHSGALHPRKHHLAWDGLCLRADDPWWKVHYPPNGWGCGCDVEALSERQMRALDKTGPDAAPKEIPREVPDPRTGQIVLRYAGVDRGWEYNVGEASLRGAVPVELQEPLPPAPIAGAGEAVPRSDLPPMPPARTVPADRLMPAGLPDTDYVDAFLAEFGASQDRGAEYRDASGAIIGVDKSLFVQRGRDGLVFGLKALKRDRGLYVRLLADALKDPDEIWADWVQVASGVALRRSYLQRVMLPDGKGMFVRFEWASAGWVGVTGFDTTDRYLDQFRRGALLFRRK